MKAIQFSTLVTDRSCDWLSCNVARDQPSARRTAFGLDIISETSLSFISGASAEPTGRPVLLSVRDEPSACVAWPESAELICDERGHDGDPVFSISSSVEAGYLISGPAYGAHVVSDSGRRVTCVSDGLPDAAWQRLLIAQVLPFAALLQGLEVFHASAVVSDGHGLAFLGPSRAGKTSLALEMCRTGATFLADDVLALEVNEGELLAHPGTPVAGVAGSAPSAVSSVEGEVLAVNDRERVVRVAGASTPVPLGTLLFIDRRRDGPKVPRFAPVTDAQLLLAATFNFVLSSPERLRRLLDVCAIAARGRVERLSVGPAATVTDLAVAVTKRLGQAE